MNDSKQKGMRPAERESSRPAMTLADYVQRFDELRALFDNLPDGVIAVLDQNLTISAANAQIGELLGLQPSAIEGMSALEVLEERLPSLAALLQDVMQTGRDVRNYTLEVPDPGGKVSHFLTSVTEVREIAPPEKAYVLMLHDISEITRLRDSALKRGRYAELVGRSAPMKRVFELIESVSASPASVLIVGETGTGKELVARAIHRKSDRRGMPFVPVHCSALPEGLIESELFGHVKGAFTGAARDRVGRFEQADGGTLFLDEVGTLDLSVQTKLLRVLQERVVEPVGSTQRKRIDVRIVAATNRGLEELIALGEFRQDLYYRLNVMKLVVPPLRDRGSDITLLADLFIKRLEKVYKKGVLSLAPAASDMLTRYPWPGNVRELENAVEHAFLLARGAVLEPDQFPAELRHAARGVILPPAEDPSGEEGEIRQALLSARGNRAEAASLLGMHRSTLWRKMREYRIEKAFGKELG